MNFEERKWLAILHWMLGYIDETADLSSYWRNEAVRHGVVPYKNSGNGQSAQRGNVIYAFRDAVCAMLKSGCSIEDLKEIFKEAPQKEKSSKYLAQAISEVWNHVSNKKMLMFLKQYGFVWDKVEVIKIFVQTGNVKMLKFVTFGDSGVCRINNWSPEYYFRFAKKDDMREYLRKFLCKVEICKKNPIVDSCYCDKHKHADDMGDITMNHYGQMIEVPKQVSTLRKSQEDKRKRIRDLQAQLEKDGETLQEKEKIIKSKKIKR